MLGNVDYGTQGKGSGASGSSAWYGAALMLRYAASSTVAVVGRGEFYDDKDQVIVVTGFSSFLPERSTTSTSALRITATSP